MYAVRLDNSPPDCGVRADPSRVGFIILLGGTAGPGASSNGGGGMGGNGNVAEKKIRFYKYVLQNKLFYYCHVTTCAELCISVHACIHVLPLALGFIKPVSFRLYFNIYILSL